MALASLANQQYTAKTKLGQPSRFQYDRTYGSAITRDPWAGQASDFTKNAVLSDMDVDILRIRLQSRRPFSKGEKSSFSSESCENLPRISLATWLAVNGIALVSPVIAVVAFFIFLTDLSVASAVPNFSSFIASLVFLLVSLSSFKVRSELSAYSSK